MGVFLLMPLWSATLPTAILGAAAYGFIGFGVSAPQTYRMVALGGEVPLTVALNAAALYLAIAFSGLVGGISVATLGSSSLGFVAAVGTAAALALSELAHLQIRRESEKSVHHRGVRSGR